ncbi:MAG: diguanylate cyclase [Gemmatimonadaceae bacterium]
MTNVAQYLRVPRLDSIRSRILALAVIGTLLPAGAALGIAYVQNRRALEEKITQELLSESTQTARAMGVWLKEQLLDLRVFASSDEVSNDLNRFAGATRSSLAGDRLRDYLRSLHERFSDFEQLMVLDLEGRVLAKTAKEAMPVHLPDEWEKTLRAEGQLVGTAYWDKKAGKGKLIVAVPVKHTDGRILGAFAAELNLTPVVTLLRSFVPDTAGVLYLAGESGALVASSRGITPQLMKSKVPPATLERLVKQDAAAISYVSFGAREVVATLERVPQVRWVVVAEMSADSAFQQVRRFRNVALLAVIALLLVVSASAYRLGLLIVRPLDRLAKGAAEVATGDLAVDLPAAGEGEVGALTKVFNDMVSRLRESRQDLDNINEMLRKNNEELERLSVTDGLTGLANHRSLMQRLDDEGIRYYRNARPFTVVMADVDHFKKYNDAFGHPAGDQVLKTVAAILRDSTRAVDCVARYGGEEFVVLLPETSMDAALPVAERIRALVEAEDFSGQNITLSIGVAEFPKDAETALSVIAVADEAMYEAKRGGRNQVVQAGASPGKAKTKTAKS